MALLKAYDFPRRRMVDRDIQLASYEAGDGAESAVVGWCTKQI